MEEAVEGGRGHWSAAIGMTFAVLVLSVFDALALVLLPLAILMVGLPAERRVKWIGAGMILWVMALALSGGGLAAMSRGWALMLGGTYLVLTLLRPHWPVLSRGLATVGVALLAGAVGLAASGRAGELDRMIRDHFEAISALGAADLQERMPDAAWIADLRTATEQVSALQAEMFPALLALQSLAALALVSWWTRRIGRSGSPAFTVHRFRDFRFNDQLIWLLIAGLILLLLPTGALVDRIGTNAVVFMVALYALRGLGIFVFLATGSKSIPTMIVGFAALIFLYPIAFTAALMMGLGDTWLDVRNRVARANPT